MTQHAELIARLEAELDEMEGVSAKHWADLAREAIAALQAMEPSGCDSCPHTVGDAYQRDCAYPDCSPDKPSVQAMERKPMTDAEVADGFCETSRHARFVGAFKDGVHFAEAFHGIQPPQSIIDVQPNVKGE